MFVFSDGYQGEKKTIVLYRRPVIARSAEDNVMVSEGNDRLRSQNRFSDGSLFL